MSMEFNHTEFVQNKLESHPIGRTTEELQSMLPDYAPEEKLVESLNRLESDGKVTQIGEKWRWTTVR